MTYIEFFSKTAAENVCACMVCPPERVVLLGEESKDLKRHAQCYRELFEKKGYSVEFVTKTIKKDNMQSCIDTLIALTNTYTDCVFDLTGGDDMYLAAIGIVSERFKDKKIQMHRYNLSNRKVIDCDLDGKVLAEGKQPNMTVEENIKIYGGAVVYDSFREGCTHRWDMSDEFAVDVWSMWDICKKDVSAWNTQMSVFAMAESMAESVGDSLTTTVPLKEFNARWRACNNHVQYNTDILYGLHDSGLITSCDYDDDVFTITYKNSQIKKCLTKSGQTLELLIYAIAKSLKDENGEAVYNDVETSVFIDWDGIMHISRDEADTENEIDVMMMHGMVPVFVSCKNGKVNIAELYKLNAVAEHFGGSYAKKILIANKLDNAAFSNYLTKRAEDMGITVIKNLKNMDREQMKLVIGKLWK